MELKKIIESILFAAGRAVGVGEIIAILEMVADGPKAARPEIEAALGELEREYAARGGSIAVVKVAEGWGMRTGSEAAPWIACLNRPRLQRLSSSAVESLAIIAYRQPLTRGEIEKIRGVDCAAVLKGLIERRLLRVVGRKEEPGRPLLYATTKEFLELFSLNDLSELPPLKEFEEMIKTTSEAAAPLEEFTLADLATAPEELVGLEEGDRELLTELDEGLKDLHQTEQQVVLTEVEKSPEVEESSEVQK